MVWFLGMQWRPVCCRDGKWGQEVHSLVLWFDTPFTERFCKEKPVMLSTSPHLEQTHWVQTGEAAS